MSARDPDVRVHVFLDATTCTLYVDTTGEPLFKRGRRDHVGEAPLKKNLAAGILRVAGWSPGMPPVPGAYLPISRNCTIDAPRMATSRKPRRRAMDGLIRRP